MSILKTNGRITPNQQVSFNDDIGDCDSCDDREYCSPVLDNEEICWQITQTACGNDMICDPVFEQVSFNLITNPRFDTNTDWTYGTKWGYDGTNFKANYSDDGSGTPGNLSQTIASGLNSGKRYRVTGVISSVSGNLSCQVQLGGNGGGPPPAQITVSGAFAIVVIAGSGTDIEISNSLRVTSFKIDDIQIREMAPCWDSDIYWTISENGAVHLPGSAVPLTQVTPPLTNGNYYYVRIVVDNMATGSLTAKCGTTAGSPITQDGEYFQYIISNGQAFGLYPSADFDGRVSLASIHTFKNDWTFDLTWIVGDIQHFITISNAGTYFEDKVNFCFTPSDYRPGGIHYNPSDPLADCFRIEMQDECNEYGDNIVLNPTWADGYVHWDFGNSNWDIDYHSAWARTVNGGVLRQYFNGLARETFDNNLFPDCLHWYYSFDLDGDFPTGPPDSTFTLGWQGNVITVNSAGHYDGVVDVINKTSNALRLVFSGFLGAASYLRQYIANVQIKCVTYVSDVYQSQSFCFQDDAGCTKVLRGYCDKKAFGIDFVNTDFELKLRIPVEIFDPIYPEEQASYIYSDGTKKITFGSSDELVSLRTGFIPDWAHRIIRIMKLCDHFFVDDIEYVAKEGDYIPEGLEGYNLKLKSAQIDLRFKTYLMQNNNCE